ncbi:MAG: ABC transporter substrate-binding protein [Alphaproteobacteria bacterium]|nr:ABC transporter substrate-binding protein [Alphaproteobacteria bacterium]
MARLSPVLLTFALLGAAPAFGQILPLPVHGLALHGEPEHKPGFSHFRYASPNARKGGDIRLHRIGTFDSFNPFVLRGMPSLSVGYTYETLMVPSDEPLSRYCLVCETVQVPEDRSWAEFVLRQEARFHDGSPVTATDIEWTFNTLRDKGHPFFRSYFAGVARVEVRDPHRVRFVFHSGGNPDLPLIVGDLPVLSRAWWTGRRFDRASLEPPLGSGPYRIEAYEPGRFVVLSRVEDHWSKDHPVNRGRWNFHRVRFDYFRDTTAALEAFKAGYYDLRLEDRALAWATQYSGEPFASGLIKKAAIPEDRVSGMQGYVMNTRRPLFSDRTLRLALTYAFDFDWSNRTLFHGAYERTRSYFNNHELAATGLPWQGELELLEPFRGIVPDEVFSAEYNPPGNAGESIRENLTTARRLLAAAGYRVEGQRLLAPDNTPVSFEILLNDPQLERVTLPYVENLRRLGIEARVRTVDTAQYTHRLHTFDFDMTAALFGQSQAPGSEQRGYWSSAEADHPGSRNLAGIRDPAVDALVELVIQSRDRETLVTRVRALDRLLQWGIYVVPHWHSKVDRVAYWDRFAQPATSPRYGFDPTTWWYDPDRPAARELSR